MLSFDGGTQTPHPPLVTSNGAQGFCAVFGIGKAGFMATDTVLVVKCLSVGCIRRSCTCQFVRSAGIQVVIRIIVLSPDSKFVRSAGIQVVIGIIVISLATATASGQKQGSSDGAEFGQVG